MPIKKTTRKVNQFVKDESMTDSDKLEFAFQFLVQRYQAIKENGRPSERHLAKFPTIEDVFDLARKL